MTPRFESIPQKLFVGNRLQMSLAENKTYQLWNSFMPVRKTVEHAIGSELYSIEIYPTDYFSAFNPAAMFEKWAAVEVSQFGEVTHDLETLRVPAGTYAVFTYKGPAHEAAQAYQYIFTKWLPASGYALDHRPHFAVMGEKYSNTNPASEEELWIPVKAKR